jgi:hypothetical protein
MEVSPLQAETADHQAEDIVHPTSEIPMDKKPIDRLLDAVSMTDRSYCLQLTFQILLLILLTLSSGAYFIAINALQCS